MCWIILLLYSVHKSGGSDGDGDGGGKRERTGSLGHK